MHRINKKNIIVVIILFIILLMITIKYIVLNNETAINFIYNHIKNSSNIKLCFDTSDDLHNIDLPSLSTEVLVLENNKIIVREECSFVNAAGECSKSIIITQYKIDTSNMNDKYNIMEIVSNMKGSGKILINYKYKNY